MMELHAVHLDVFRGGIAVEWLKLILSAHPLKTPVVIMSNDI